MNTASLNSRITRLESKAADEQAAFHVISNMCDADGYGSFLSKHRRFKTLAEMDAEESELRASGKVRPGEEVHRLYMSIVDAKGRVVEQSE